MKSLLLVVVMLGFSVLGMAQSDNLNSGDSLHVELARTTISAELIQLRDSIAISILALDAKLKKTMPSEGMKLSAASKELTGYKDQLELDIEEIAQTGHNSWNADAIKRIQLATSNTRREHKRICTLL